MRLLIVTREDGWPALLYTVQSIASIEVVGVARDGRHAVALAAELAPDAVLMEVRTDFDGCLEWVRALGESAPGAQVVLASLADDLQFLGRAMMAGARDFLLEPFSPDDLVRSLATVTEAVQARRDNDATVPHASAPGAGKTVVVFNPTRGVGCTTVAANLAVALRRASGAKVALLELDLVLGNLDVFLDLKPDTSLADLIGIVDQMDTQGLGDVLTKHSSGVDVLAAVTEGKSTQSGMPTLGDVSGALSALTRMYDVVVVDLGADFADVVRLALTRGDVVLLLVTPDVAAIKTLNQFVVEAAGWGWRNERGQLVLNKLDAYGLSAEDVGRSLGRKLLLSLRDDRKACMVAMNHGIPAVIAFPDSAFSQDMLRLTTLVARELDLAVNLAPEPARKVERAPDVGRAMSTMAAAPVAFAQAVGEAVIEGSTAGFSTAWGSLKQAVGACGSGIAGAVGAAARGAGRAVASTARFSGRVAVAPFKIAGRAAMFACRTTARAAAAGAGVVSTGSRATARATGKAVGASARGVGAAARLGARGATAVVVFPFHITARAARLAGRAVVLAGGALGHGVAGAGRWVGRAVAGVVRLVGRGVRWIGVTAASGVRGIGRGVGRIGTAWASSAARRKERALARQTTREQVREAARLRAEEARRAAEEVALARAEAAKRQAEEAARVRAEAARAAQEAAAAARALQTQAAVAMPPVDEVPRLTVETPTLAETAAPEAPVFEAPPIEAVAGEALEPPVVVEPITEMAFACAEPVVVSEPVLPAVTPPQPVREPAVPLSTLIAAIMRDQALLAELRARVAAVENELAARATHEREVERRKADLLEAMDQLGVPLEASPARDAAVAEARAHLAQVAEQMAALQAETVELERQITLKKEEADRAISKIESEPVALPALVDQEAVNRTRSEKAALLLQAAERRAALEEIRHRSGLTTETTEEFRRLEKRLAGLTRESVDLVQRLAAEERELASAGLDGVQRLYQVVATVLATSVALAGAGMWAAFAPSARFLTPVVGLVAFGATGWRMWRSRVSLRRTTDQVDAVRDKLNSLLADVSAYAALDDMRRKNTVPEHLRGSLSSLISQLSVSTADAEARTAVLEAELDGLMRSLSTRRARARIGGGAGLSAGTALLLAGGLVAIAPVLSFAATLMGGFGGFVGVCYLAVAGAGRLQQTARLSKLRREIGRVLRQHGAVMVEDLRDAYTRYSTQRHDVARLEAEMTNLVGVETRLNMVSRELERLTHPTPQRPTAPIENEQQRLRAQAARQRRTEMEAAERLKASLQSEVQGFQSELASWETRVLALLGSDGADSATAEQALARYDLLSGRRSDQEALERELAALEAELAGIAGRRQTLTEDRAQLQVVEQRLKLALQECGVDEQGLELPTAPVAAPYVAPQRDNVATPVRGD